MLRFKISISCGNTWMFSKTALGSAPSMLNNAFGVCMQVCIDREKAFRPHFTYLAQNLKALIISLTVYEYT